MQKINNEFCVQQFKLLMDQKITGTKENVRIPYDMTSARSMIKKVLFRNRIETNINELWTTMNSIFNIPFDSENHKIKSLFSKCHADTKCEFGINLKKVRSEMNRVRTPYLGETDEQYIKYKKHLTENNLIENFTGNDGLILLAPVTENAVNEIWSINIKEDPPANLGMEIVTSMLCAMTDEEIPAMFADKGKGSFCKLDAILLIQETSQIYVTKFRLLTTDYPFPMPKKQKQRDEDEIML